jgi:hypothetical protein
MPGVWILYVSKLRAEWQKLRRDKKASKTKCTGLAR